MEPEVRAYLIRIVNTLALGILWMVLNSTAGIMYDLAFIHDKISLGNILFYIWLITSFIFLVRHFIRMWSKPLNIPK